MTQLALKFSATCRQAEPIDDPAARAVQVAHHQAAAVTVEPVKARERDLWRAVLQQALSDLASPDPASRQDALRFFGGVRLLRVLELAGIDRDYVPKVRAKAWALASRFHGFSRFGKRPYYQT